MGRKLTATRALLAISALGAATLVSACSTSARTPAASTGPSSATPTSRATTATPSRTSPTQASPTVDLAGATCASFQAMSNANQMAIGVQWRDAHPNAMGNPMYAELDPSGKASYLAMTIGAYCSQPGHSDVRIANLSF